MGVVERSSPSALVGLATAASRALELAVLLVTSEAGCAVADAGRLREGCSALCARVQDGLGDDAAALEEVLRDVVSSAADVVEVAERLEAGRLRTYPTIVGASVLAEAAASVAVEALAEGEGSTDVERLSRRMRQIVVVETSLSHVRAARDASRALGRREVHA